MSHRTVKNFLSAVALVVMILQGVNPANAATPKSEAGKVCTIVGTAKADTLRGTTKSDVICGLGGNDVIIGGTGADILDGGVGTDTLRGGSGNDSLYGGAGNDNLQGETGTDSFRGGEGLNSCDLGAESAEMRDYTCSLIPKLSYMFERIQGRFLLDGVNFDGCTIQVIENDPNTLQEISSATGLIYDGGRFSFDALPGDYEMRVNVLLNENSQAVLPQPSYCKAPKHLSILGFHFMQNSKTIFRVFNVPALRTTRVVVRNTRGESIAGAKVMLNGGNTLIDSKPENLTGDLMIGFAPALLGYTNSRGYLDIKIPEGDFSVRASVSLAGVRFTSPFQAAIGNPSNLKIVLGK